MLKFFAPSDFKETEEYVFSTAGKLAAAAIANEKLAREGKIVQSIGNSFESPKYLTLLIDLGTIEQCKHPLDKITVWDGGSANFTRATCQCGVTVKPTAFTAVDNETGLDHAGK